MIGEYRDRLYVYEIGYDSIDGDVQAHLTQDCLELQYSRVEGEKEEFLNIVDELRGTLDEISDILSLSAPSKGMIGNSFMSLMRKSKVLNEKVGTYEEGHRNDCAGVKDQISSIRAMILSLSKNSQVTISSYRAGAILENPAFLSLQNSYSNSTAYYQGNGENIKAAREYIDTREALAEARVEKGAWDVAAAVGTIVIGAAAIIVTGGAAAPLVAIAIGSTLAYGMSNGVEAIQDIQYGLAGDINTVAGNSIRDTVFLGNQGAYDTWGTISTGISLGFCIPGASASAGKVTIAGAKQGIQTFLGSGAKNIAKSTASFGAKTLLVGGSSVAVEKVVTPYTSEDFGRLSSLLAGAYVGSKVFGVKPTETKGGNSDSDFVDLMSPEDASRYNKYWSINESSCTTDDLYRYLNNIDEDMAETYLKTGYWPNDVQIPKSSSVLKADGSINWSEVPSGGYTLDVNKNPIKDDYIPNIGETLDRYGTPNGRYTSPIIDDVPYSYDHRSLPFVAESGQYHQYTVKGDFNKIESYVENCSDTKLKAQIEAYVDKYYSGDYSKITTYKGEIASGFGATGKGIQYELPLPVEWLEDLGLINEIK